MRSSRTLRVALAIPLLVAVFGDRAQAQGGPEVSLGVDVVSRYIWRGLNAADAPSVQPSIAFGFKGFELGTWGSYSLSNQRTDADEMDFWVGYGSDFGEGGTFGWVLTDYYFPNGGIAFSNFGNYDDADGPGAHLLEIGATLGLPGALPLTFGAYVNVYNDEGHNAYFQVDWPVVVSGTEVNFFVGATPGSDKAPDYYGTDAFSVINLGLTVTRDVPFGDRFSLPLSGTWGLNPKVDIAYLVIGFSL